MAKRNTPKEKAAAGLNKLAFELNLALCRQRLDDLDLTPTDLAVMRIIATMTGRERLEGGQEYQEERRKRKRICLRSGLTNLLASSSGKKPEEVRPNISKAVASLVRRDLIMQEEFRNKRQHQLTLAPDGLDLIERLEEPAMAQIVELLDGENPAAINAAIEIIRRVAWKHLRKYIPPPP